MRRGFLVGALVLTAAGAFAQSPALTLDQAVADALTSGLDKAVLAANADAARALYAKTISAAGPAVTLTGSVDESGTPTALAGDTRTATAGATVSMGSSSLTVKGSQSAPVSGSAGTQGFSVALTQNLWDGYLGGQTGGTAAQYTLEQKSADLTAQANVRALVQSVKTSYYTLLSAQENRIALASTLAQNQRSLDLMQARFDAKQASVIDLQTAKINQRTAQINLQQGDETLRQAKLALAHLTGRADLNVTVAETEETAPAPATVAEALAYALAHRYERSTTVLDLQAAQVGLDLARAAGHPTVDLTASAARSGTSGATADTFSLGVNVSWTAWDSGVTGQSVLRQEALVRAAEATKKAQDLTIEREVQSAWADWNLKAAKAGLAQMTTENTRAAFAVAQAQNQAGTLTNAALLTAQTDFMDAQAAQAAAVINLRLAVLTLKTALGYEE